MKIVIFNDSWLADDNDS